MDGITETQVFEARLHPANLSPATRRFTAAALVISLATVAALAITLITYALPVESDWARAARLGNTPHDMGWWHYVFSFTYMRWQGRWASCGIEALVLPHIDPTRYYPWLIGAIAVINGVGVYIICRWFTRAGPGALAVVMTLTALALFWAGMPSLAEDVHWFTGAVENSMVLSLSALLLIAIVSLRPVPNINFSRAVLLVIVAIATFVICGFHELYASILWLVLLTGLLTSLWTRDGLTRTWALFWIVATVGLFVVVLAPGNARRMHIDGGPHSHQVGYDLRLTLSSLWQDGRAWIFDPKLIAASIWVAFSPALESARTAWPSARRIAWRAIIPVLWIAMLGVGFFFPCWAFGNGVPPRTLSGNYIIFVSGWLLIVYAWTRPLARAPEKTTAQSGLGIFHLPTAAVAIQLLAVAILLTGNVPLAIRDLIIRVRPWHTAAAQRYELLRHAAGAETVTLPRLPPQPWTLHAGEIAEDPKNWHNADVAAYFHIKTLTLEPSTKTTAAPESPAREPSPE